MMIMWKHLLGISSFADLTYEQKIEEIAETKKKYEKIKIKNKTI